MTNIMKKKKAVLYLDVDGVLIQWRQDRTREFYMCHPRGFPARRVSDFLEWIDKHFEVRWLTAWTLCGKMHPDTLAELRNVLDADVPDYWDNPRDWYNGPDVVDIGKVRGLILTKNVLGFGWMMKHLNGSGCLLCFRIG